VISAESDRFCGNDFFNFDFDRARVNRFLNVNVSVIGR